MEKSHRITVTKNVKYCLQLLGDTVKDLPEGGKKVLAQDALDYLNKTAQGESQPLRGVACQAPIRIVPD